ncbi:MAG: hypothetical protein WCI47_02605, partial [bacterium]
PIITADQSLRGISFLTLPVDGEYKPRQIIMLSGTISGYNVLLFGNYDLRDHNWAELSSLQNANEKSFKDRRTAIVNDFKAGKIADDTKEIADELNIAIKSIKLTLAPGQE